MEFEPRHEIREYIAGQFSPEKQAELNLSLDIFEAFDYGDIWHTLIDVLYDLNREDVDATEQSFLAMLDEHLEKVFEAHRIAVLDETPLTVKNQILSALYRIQHVDDPVPYLRLLETDLENEEKLARIVELLSEIDFCRVLEALEEVPTSTLVLLEVHLTQLEARQQHQLETGTQHQLLLENLKDFFHVHGQTNLAYEMSQNDIPMGLPVKEYYPYIGEHLVTPHDEQTALNITGLFFYAGDTYQDPLKIFHQYSEALFPVLERRIRIEALIGQLVTAVRHYQKAKHDAASVSTAQHQA